MNEVIVIGGGLAGSEAAWQLAQRNVKVKLYEMRPVQSTGAHATNDLAELVCSNSLGTNQPDRASGLLKNELRRLDSLLVECAEETALPAGAALAVDRKNRIQPKHRTDPRRSEGNSESTRHRRQWTADIGESLQIHCGVER